ncbi:PcfJ domain-containing protein [Rhizobium sp. BK176]|uniref:PcfJ domain-containing protein n=1 Tax=Rhizobium sp. BK176 TaxID=2587071 RepID=UPI002167ABAD|nr:PcfJ domain-containing protein [Rhizobium sp. BK176]MCS4088649.1 hypothetical protein [Rhizobium sp. BK176]
MAGTGHRYEISNPTAVETFVARWRDDARSREINEALSWLSSRHFLKYLTGELFSFRLKPAHVINSPIPDEKRQHILTKVLAGEEVRRFDPDLFETLGADLHHILDWIAELKRTEDPLYKKVSRMDTRVLATKADAWTKRLNANSIAYGGTSDPLLSVSPDLTWFELKDSAALRYEGSMMSHCVGGFGYAQMVDSGKTRIFSLRKDTVKPVLTVEISNGERGPTLIQIQKRANGGLPVAYCDAAVSLLNTLGVHDFHGVGRRYALVYAHGHWTSIFDTWDTIHFLGRTVLSDQRSLMFMSAKDPSKPLMVVEHALGPQAAKRWYTADFEPLMVRIKPADDMTPHYEDQLEACEIANYFVRGDVEKARGFGLPWMRTVGDTATLVPEVDTYERIEMPDGFFYKQRCSDESAAECYLPHSDDPARLLMVAAKTKYDIEANVLPGQRISRAEAQRCLDFLTATKVKWFKNDASDSRTTTTEFYKLCQPTLIPETREWRSFVADMVEVPAKTTDGRWQETDYLLRYFPDNYGSIDIHMHAGAVTRLSGFRSDKKDLVEIVAKLRQKRLTSERFLTLSRIGKKGADAPAIFTLDGRWVWSDNERKFRTLAQQTIEAFERNVDSVSEPVLNGLLTHCNAMLRDDALKTREAVHDARSRLLVAWFMRVASFENYAVRRGGLWSALDDQVHYALIDRLVDLADLGFVLDSRKSKAQFKKALARVSQAYGRRTDLMTETEVTEFVVRWHRVLPKKFMNMTSTFWLSCPTWLAKPDVAGRLLDILADERTRKTKFRDAVWSQAEKTISDANYASMDARELANHAKLFHAVSKSRYVLYSRNIEALDTLVKHLNAAPVTADVPLDELRQVHAKYRTAA